jgi:hypothetical protein
MLKKIYGVSGLLLLLGIESMALLDIPFFQVWVTPVGWYGYILFFDWLVLKREGSSPLTSDRWRTFLLMFPVSVLLWSIFEAHNMLFRNWEYTGLPENVLLTGAGFVLSFATILPAIYVTYLFLSSFRVFDIHVTPHVYTRSRLLSEVGTGAFLVALPVFFPSTYTGPLVWAGYFLVFPALNRLLGLPSVLDERAKGRIGGTYALMAAGYVCGLVWEFLNFWAGGRWIYHVPYLPQFKIFEMPVIGFLGFGPFAVAFLEMYRFVRYGPAKFFRGRK